MGTPDALKFFLLNCCNAFLKVSVLLIFLCYKSLLLWLSEYSSWNCISGHISFLHSKIPWLPIVYRINPRAPHLKSVIVSTVVFTITRTTFRLHLVFYPRPTCYDQFPGLSASLDFLYYFLFAPSLFSSCWNLTLHVSLSKGNLCSRFREQI